MRTFFLFFVLVLFTRPSLAESDSMRFLSLAGENLGAILMLLELDETSCAYANRIHPDLEEFIHGLQTKLLTNPERIEFAKFIRAQLELEKKRARSKVRTMISSIESSDIDRNTGCGFVAGMATHADPRSASTAVGTQFPLATTSTFRSSTRHT